MKPYTVASVRAQLAQALDRAEDGAEVVIERRGVRFRLVVDATEPKRGKPAPLFESLDRRLDAGWTWAPDADGQLHLVVGGRSRAAARAAIARAKKRERR